MLLLLAALCLFCATPGLAHGSFVYVTNYGDGTISQFRENPSGTLSPLSPPTVRAHSLCHSLAVARGRFLYAISAKDWSRRDCVVCQYEITPSGRLRPLSPAEVLCPGTPSALAVGPRGRFLYVFSREGTVLQLRIGARGRLTPLSPAVIPVIQAGGVVPNLSFDVCHSVLYGTYHVAWGAGNVTSGQFACTVKRNGQLHLLPTEATAENAPHPHSVSLSPRGQFAYVAENVPGLPHTYWHSVIASYRTRPNGGLTPLSPPSMPVESAGKSAVDPAGRFLYLLFETVDDLHATGAYRLARAPIQKEGRLGAFSYQKFARPASLPPVQEFSLAFGAEHTAYFVEGGYIYLFHVQSGGALTPQRPARIWAGYGPLGIVCVQN